MLHRQLKIDCSNEPFLFLFFFFIWSLAFLFLFHVPCSRIPPESIIVICPCLTLFAPFLPLHRSLSSDDTMTKLLDYVTIEPPKDLDEKIRFK